MGRFTDKMSSYAAFSQPKREHPVESLLGCALMAALGAGALWLAWWIGDSSVDIATAGGEYTPEHAHEQRRNPAGGLAVLVGLFQVVCGVVGVCLVVGALWYTPKTLWMMLRGERYVD